MEILKDDNLTPWRQLLADPDIVGPVYVVKERQWRVDMRSKQYSNAFKTSRLGVGGMLYQIDMPTEVVEQLILNEIIFKGDSNE